MGVEITVKLDGAQYANLIGRLDDIRALLAIGNQEEKKIMGILDDIEAELAENTSVASGIETLIANIHAAGEGDPVRLKAVLDTLKANDARVAKLITDNTPAATPGPPPDPVDPQVNPLR